jgi:predicted protein tyrosine phosphatase
MVKILTVCSQGLCRSVGLADVLKLHFEPVDVIPAGVRGNTQETLAMLGNWADWIIVMQAKYINKIPMNIDRRGDKLLVCDVGPDRYGNSHHRELIDQVWQWARRNQAKIGITEHNRRI